jgi:hypothetical protein
MPLKREKGAKNKKKGYLQLSLALPMVELFPSL